jgi:dipeptidase D
MEDHAGVVLQGHIDMVCQQNAGTGHDFERDPIRPLLDDGWLVARDTTLGADNGIGVALALAALEAKDIAHGPLEVLLTVDEEAGMGGARNLQPGLLQGRLMLNLDTEEWGSYYTGCAGGMDVVAHFPCPTEAAPANVCFRRIALTGLRGGHSGIDIHRGRGNAIKALAQLLAELQGLDLRLSGLEGGTARNALPREAWALVAVPGEHLERLTLAIADFERALRKQLSGKDEPPAIRLSDADPAPLLTAAAQQSLLSALNAAPQGVKRMSAAVPGVVETSDNLGVIRIEAGRCEAVFMVRSLIDAAADKLADQIVTLCRSHGGTAEKVGAYPGWQPDPDSPLLALGLRVFEREFGATPQIQVIHAGLECGLIGARYPGMDMLSFGPDIRGAHAPGEAVEIASVGRCWHLLKALLAAVPPLPKD